LSKTVVSVYVVTFNRAKKLARCLDSIISQTFKSFEIIIVDNGSSDETHKVLEHYKSLHNNLSYILLGENKGACYARNVAIRASKGIYVTGVDDDDEWLPERIKVMLSAYSDEYSAIYADDFFIGKKTIKKNKKPKLVNLESMKYQNFVGNQVLTRRNRFIEAGLFDETLVAAQDYDMWFRLIEKYGPAKNVCEALQRIHVDGDDRITKSKHKKHGYYCFYKKHKHHLTRNQRKYQLLNAKYVFQDKISIKFFAYLFSPVKPKRHIGIFMKRVVLSGTFGF
jgi:glycosyltransferase involved in cell wall biosynthesis